MKRSEPVNSASSGSLSGKRNAGVAFYLEEDTQFSVNERSRAVRMVLDSRRLLQTNSPE